jgi:hypothetical protein
MHFIDISLEFGTAESLFVFCRIGAKYTKKRRFWTLWYGPYQAWYGPYQTWYGPYQIWYGPYQT